MGRCLGPGGGAEFGTPGLLGKHQAAPVRCHLQAHERLEETKLEAVRDNNLELVQEILRDLAQLAEQSSTAAELARILQEPHFQVWFSPGKGWGAWQKVRAGMGRDLRALPHGSPLPSTSLVPPGDTRLCGLKDLRDATPQPWPGPHVQQPACAS